MDSAARMTTAQLLFGSGLGGTTLSLAAFTSGVLPWPPSLVVGSVASFVTFALLWLVSRRR